MSEFRPEIPTDLTSPEDYLDLYYDFSEFTWSSSVRLVAGTVLRLSHESSPFVSIFESTDPQPSLLRTAGFVSQFDNGEETLSRQRGSIRLAHIQPAMAQMNIPFVEFNYVDEDGRKVNLHPAFTSAEQYVNSDLSEELNRQHKIYKELLPFESEDAQSVLDMAIAFMIERAVNAEDDHSSDDYQLTAQIIQDDLLK